MYSKRHELFSEGFVLNKLKYQLHLGDSVEILKSIPSDSIDALVTDPPAGVGLFGLEWDQNKGGRDQWILWLSTIMSECYRILKPGAHGFVWALPRTSHWTGFALESSNFIIKDVVTHIFGSGFPKNTFLEKAMNRVKYPDTDFLFQATAWIRQRRDELGLTNKDLDSIAGVKGGACHWTASTTSGQPNVPTKERWDKLSKTLGPAPDWLESQIQPSFKQKDFRKNVKFEPSTETEEWRGWGTALKPASENWILVQKPISEHNIAANIRKYRVGAINIDESRIPVIGKIPSTSNLNFLDGGLLWDSTERSEHSVYHQHPKGRFPANLILSKTTQPSGPTEILNSQTEDQLDVSQYFKKIEPELPFYYCKKSPKKEKGEFNSHPTVKPINLMQYLCKMIAPTNGIIVDPFMGSGSTGVAAIKNGFQFIGIEKNQSYFEIAKKRLEGIKYE